MTFEYVFRQLDEASLPDSNSYSACSQGGVNYIAQVLKRNQHLKVLNLSENRIDAAGLASLAEALVSYLVLTAQRIS